MSDLYKVFGERVSAERKRQGLSQQQLAEMVDVSRGTIVNIENGKFNIPFMVGIDLAAVLNLNLREIFPLENVNEQTN